MGRKRISAAKLLGLLLGYSVIGIFGFWLAPARADVKEEAGAAEASAPAEGARPVEPLRPFEKNPTGPGAIPFSELRDTPPRPLTKSEIDSGSLSAARYREVTTDTKESVEKAGAWAKANHGAATTAAWSKVTDEGVARANEGNARYESGLSGTDDIGVR